MSRRQARASVPRRNPCSRRQRTCRTRRQPRPSILPRLTSSRAAPLPTTTSLRALIPTRAPMALRRPVGRNRALRTRGRRLAPRVRRARALRAAKAAARAVKAAQGRRADRARARGRAPVPGQVRVQARTRLMRVSTPRPREPPLQRSSDNTATAKRPSKEGRFAVETVVETTPQV